MDRHLKSDSVGQLVASLFWLNAGDTTVLALVREDREDYSGRGEIAVVGCYLSQDRILDFNR